MKKPSVEEIDALLPQTQCRLCEFDGCKPYAKAIASREAPLNRCLPGGVAVLQQLGQLMQQDITSDIDAMRRKTKASTRVQIDESMCIGCTKCMDVCPTDAILGSGKKMHTVIAQACTGCELCLPPCPVDCIEILPNHAITQEQSNDWRIRYEQKNKRLKRLQSENNDRYQQKLKPDIDERKRAMMAALERVQKKKSHE
jgi:electron transport complex protein RnfB